MNRSMGHFFFFFVCLAFVLMALGGQSATANPKALNMLAPTNGIDPNFPEWLKGVVSGAPYPDVGGKGKLIFINYEQYVLSPKVSVREESVKDSQLHVNNATVADLTVGSRVSFEVAGPAGNRVISQIVVNKLPQNK